MNRVLSEAAITISEGLGNDRLMSLNRTFQTAQKILESLLKVQTDEKRILNFDDPPPSSKQ